MDAHQVAPETSHSNYCLSLIGVIGSFLLFLFILLIAYLPNRPAPVNQAIVQNRLNNLAQVRSAQKEAATEYAWINQQEGLLRIPINQAMQLATERLGKDQPTIRSPQATSEQTTAIQAKGKSPPQAIESKQPSSEAQKAKKMKSTKPVQTESSQQTTSGLPSRIQTSLSF